MPKEIILTRGEVTIVDDDMYEYLNQFKWCLHGKYVISRSKILNPETKYTYMHRLICQTPKGYFADHINGNKLDNRKSNLRNVTAGQNAMNKRKHIKKTSKYKGVNWNKQREKWEAIIYIDGKLKYISSFKTEEDAANAYNVFAKKHFGEYAHLNDVPFNPNWEETKYQKYRKGTSKYRGVHYNKTTNKWVANVVGLDGKKRHLGLFDSEINAAKKYNEYVKKHLNKPWLLNDLE